ncbi:MAG: hypothetical protein RQ741_14455, partial [Wenzhouxiangellaceae bacterium]|nr:hypothetical protein [Wenzhouxiangellaceae bacterium]
YTGKREILIMLTGNGRQLIPGRGRVVAEFQIDQALIDEIRTATADGAKYEPTLAIDIVDDQTDIVAHVTRTLYIRRKRSTA